MVAGVLLFLVMVDTFLTGWLLKSLQEMNKVVAGLGEVSQVHAHDIDLLGRAVGMTDHE